MDPMKYIVPGRKRLPYGMMNFADIRLDNYYYVDKTRFIPMIEEADRFFFFITCLFRLYHTDIVKKLSKCLAALLVCLRNVVLQFNFSYVIIRYIKILKHRSEKEYQQYREEKPHEYVCGASEILPYLFYYQT